MTAAEMGARGAKVLIEQRGQDWLAVIGRRGGASTLQRYGVEHYARMGRLAAEAKRKRKAGEAEAGEG